MERLLLSIESMTPFRQLLPWFVAGLFCASCIVACSVEGPPESTASTSTGSNGQNQGGGAHQGGAESTGGSGGTMTSDGGSGGVASGNTTVGVGGSGGAETGVGGSGGSAGPTTPQGCTAQGIALINELNAYRVSKGLAPVVASSSLCIVSELHIADLAANKPHAVPGCNLHSWSDQGSWSPCCYTSDHKQASCMWNKPSELSAYPGYGYEISASGTNSPKGAVGLWKTSKGHDAVMVNEGIWKGMAWNAVGAAIDNGYAVIWFGAQADPMP